MGLGENSARCESDANRIQLRLGSARGTMMVAVVGAFVGSVATSAAMQVRDRRRNVEIRGFALQASCDCTARCLSDCAAGVSLQSRLTEPAAFDCHFNFCM